MQSEARAPANVPDMRDNILAEEIIETMVIGLMRSELHQQKIIPSGRNGSVRVDVVRQSRQRHPGGSLLRAGHQYHASGCISPSHRSFTLSSRSVGLLF